MILKPTGHCNLSLEALTSILVDPRAPRSKCFLFLEIFGHLKEYKLEHRAIVLSHPCSYIYSIPHTLNICGTHPHKQTMPGWSMVVSPTVVQNASLACFSPARFMLQPTCYCQSRSGDNLGHYVHLCSSFI